MLRNGLWVSFFFVMLESREFDENLLRRISEVFYEDEVVNLPPAPDVSNYMISEVFQLI